MNHKEELKKLIEIVKEFSRTSGQKLTSEEIAKRLGYERPYLSQLIGPKGVVNESHVLMFKAKFKEELEKAGIPLQGDISNPERVLLLAFLEDYAEWKAEQTGIPFKDVRKGIQRRATAILKGLDGWLPESD